VKLKIKKPEEKKSAALRTGKIGQSQTCKIENCEDLSCVGCSWNKD